jgi:HEPN domain-containing protein
MLMVPKNERRFKPEYAKTLLEIAQGDLESAEVLLMAAKGRKENIGYLVSQVIEKSLKAVIVHLNLPLPLSHDLGLLKERVHQHLPFDAFSDLSSFTEFATFRRYESSSMILEPEDLQASVEIAKQVLAWAQKVVCHGSGV